MKVMFVCTGNICRSAMAEAMFNKMLEEKNRVDIEVFSCGIYADDGDIPTENAIETMREYNIDLNRHRATNIKNSQIEKMDIILCATLSHKIQVLGLYTQLQGKVFTMKEYAGLAQEGRNYDIADPWGYDFKTYQSCSKEIEECLEKILERIS